MKKYILYILVGIASWGLASCNGFLDVDQYFNDLYQLDSVFTKRSTTEQWLWKVYSRLDANREICNKMSNCGIGGRNAEPVLTLCFGGLFHEKIDFSIPCREKVCYFCALQMVFPAQLVQVNDGEQRQIFCF